MPPSAQYSTCFLFGGLRTNWRQTREINRFHSSAGSPPAFHQTKIPSNNFFVQIFFSFFIALPFEQSFQFLLLSIRRIVVCCCFSFFFIPFLCFLPVHVCLLTDSVRSLTSQARARSLRWHRFRNNTQLIACIQYSKWIHVEMKCLHSEWMKKPSALEGGAELWGRLKQCKISYWGADVEEAQRVLACKQTAIENYIYVTFRRSVALENVR